MSDVLQTTTYRSGGDNLLESIKSFLVGLVMFFAAFPILWWNEGCTDMSTVAKTAVVISPEGAGADGEGKLVAVTAKLEAEPTTGDPDMLSPGPYVELRREAQMYAWVEHKSSTTEKKIGGGSKKVTTYRYEREWTASPASTDSFEEPRGHRNPRLDIRSEVFHPETAKVGAFSFSPGEAGLPDAEALPLTADMVKLAKHEEPPPPAPPTASAKAGAKGAPPGKKPVAAPSKGAPSAKASASAKADDDGEDEEDDDGKDEGGEDDDEDEDARNTAPFRFVSGVLFRGAGTPEAPVVGDVKVTYRAVMPGKLVTLYGTRHGSSIEPFMHDGKDKLYRVVEGTHEQAIASLHDEHQRITWGVRAAGFFMMWIGLALIVSPFNALLDFIPFLGSAGRFVTGLVMAPIAALLAGVTILVAIVAHSPILLALVILALVAGFTVLIVKRRKQKASQAPPAVVAGAMGPGPGWGPGGMGPGPGGMGPGPGGPGWGPPQ